VPSSQDRIASRGSQGIAVAELSTKSDAFVVHEVPYIDGALRLGLAKYAA
jgi:hypothetical protein